MSVGQNSAADASAMNRVEVHRLAVDRTLLMFINEEVLPGTGIAPDRFWRGFSEIIFDMTPQNSALLVERDRLQSALDGWHRDHRDSFEAGAYRSFLEEIGYISREGPDFTIGTMGVDPEIASIAGPQLVVPVSNARYALNAANARWGSLYDALYGTDAVPEADGRSRHGRFDELRGAMVVQRAKAHLDAAAPLAEGSHADAVAYLVHAGGLVISLADGRTTRLTDPDGFAGYSGEPRAPDRVLLRRHGLHIELVIDPDHQIGRSDPAGIADIRVEAAITTIVDFEDSVAAVDAEDKVAAYRNWLGLMRGDLSVHFVKEGKTIQRALAQDEEFLAPGGTPITLSGRALLLVRNVGHLMRSDAVLDSAGEPVFEGLLDAMVTAAISLHDIGPTGAHRNSRSGAVYIVKPKMHGPAEVAFTTTLFGRVEAVLDLPLNSLKMGIMDEERRTSVNLEECIRAAADRVCFINTGFLDRTGDEIHTAMEAGPMIRKNGIKDAAWIAAYEDRNVDVGIACGLPGRAQIGKGMWAMPDRMAAMMDAKIAHPGAGASTAWVPSPTAAILHSLHYHLVDVAARQREIAPRGCTRLEDLLTIPVADRPDWNNEQIRAELENNAQGILGYVVRWIDHGVGCSKVPDINNVGLMEDRATLRISSQHIANWLRHGVCSRGDVVSAFRRMAAVVDCQNREDPSYRPIATDTGSSIAFAAACDLVFDGIGQPNGYTEPILHARRRQAKRAIAAAAAEQAA